MVSSKGWLKKHPYHEGTFKVKKSVLKYANRDSEVEAHIIPSVVSLGLHDHLDLLALIKLLVCVNDSLLIQQWHSMCDDLCGFHQCFIPL